MNATDTQAALDAETAAEFRALTGRLVAAVRQHQAGKVERKRAWKESRAARKDADEELALWLEQPAANADDVAFGRRCGQLVRAAESAADAEREARGEYALVVANTRRAQLELRQTCSRYFERQPLFDFAQRQAASPPPAETPATPSGLNGNLPLPEALVAPTPGGKGAYQGVEVRPGTWINLHVSPDGTADAFCDFGRLGNWHESELPEGVAYWPDANELSEAVSKAAGKPMRLREWGVSKDGRLHELSFIPLEKAPETKPRRGRKKTKGKPGKNGKAKAVEPDPDEDDSEPHPSPSTGEGTDPLAGTCRICGCTEQDCRRCVERTGEPCGWAGETATLCTACEELAATSLDAIGGLSAGGLKALRVAGIITVGRAWAGGEDGLSAEALAVLTDPQTGPTITVLEDWIKGMLRLDTEGNEIMPDEAEINRQTITRDTWLKELCSIEAAKELKALGILSVEDLLNAAELYPRGEGSGQKAFGYLRTVLSSVTAAYALGDALVDAGLIGPDQAPAATPTNGAAAEAKPKRRKKAAAQS